MYLSSDVSSSDLLLIDPNTWSRDGATALAEWVPSEDGRRLLYSVQDGGTDWRTVKVLDVASGQPLADTVEWVKFSNLAWARDGSGFYYSRFPKPQDGEKFQALNTDQAIYFHRLGSPPSQDVKIYATPDHPNGGHFPAVSDDGRRLLVPSGHLLADTG